MILWRISNHETLDGAGGLRASGRWHSRGHRVVYCAPNPATALLEVLVHLEVDIEDLPVQMRYLEIEAPDNLRPDRINGGSRDHGDQWLRAGTAVMLEVPSAVVPETWNVLLNPAHADAGLVKIRRSYLFALDRRLIRG